MTMMMPREEFDRATADLIGAFLTNIATAGSLADASRCINLPGFEPAVVERLVTRLLKRAPSAVIKVSPAYRRTTNLSESVFLNPESESFTTYRNQRSGLTILVPDQALGDERESLESIDTRDAHDILLQVEDLVGLVEGARERFADEYDGIIRFLRLVVELAQPSLKELAAYVLRVYDARTAGELTVYALGEALPELGAFRFREAFRSVNLRDPDKHARWRASIQKAVVINRDHALKRAPNGSLLQPEALEEYLRSAEPHISDPGALQVLRDFVAAPTMDVEARQKALELDWKDNGVQLIFKRSTRDSSALGAATYGHLVATRREPMPLPDENLLKEIDARPELFEDEREPLLDFYDRYRTDIGANRTLVTRWERRLFPHNIEETDFLLALLKAAHDLLGESGANEPGSLKLKVTLDLTPQKILESVNREAIRYFAVRYRGLQTLLAPHVELILDSLQRVETWDWMAETGAESEGAVPAHLREALSEYREDERVTRSRNRIPFEVALFRVQSGHEPVPVPGAVKKITWAFPNQSFLAGFPFDLEQHRGNPLRYYDIPRSMSSPKGVQPPVALDSPRCVETSENRKPGRLVGKGTWETHDILAKVKQALTDMGQLVAPETRDRVLQLVQGMNDQLVGALNAFADEGLAWSGWTAFSVQFEETLGSLLGESSGERFAKSVIAPVLLSGVAFVGTSRATAIIPPLHPLRLISLYVKAHQAADLLEKLLGEQMPAIDGDLFVSSLEQEFAHTYYPELLYSGTELLVEESRLGDYSLSTPVAQDRRLSSRPQEAAKVLRAVVKDYVTLHPHEKDNLSVLLHSVSAARFPQAVVDEFARSAGAELAGAKCRLALRDPDGQRLQTHYRDFVGAMGENGHGAETDLTFLSRFGVTAVGGHANSGNIKPGDMDIAFLYDRVSAAASVRWHALSSTLTGAPVDLASQWPAHWSKKLPSDATRMRSASYLCCPVNPSSVRQYYRAIAACCDPGYQAETLSLPIREIRYDVSDIKNVLRESHEAAKWVVNFDSLLDRHQLEQLGVQVIRYRPSREADRSLIISSKEQDYIVHSHLLARIRRFDLLPADVLDGCIRTIIQRANDISGNLVLTAAGRGYFTNELLGAVLSARLLTLRVPSHLANHGAMIYLDDYGMLFAHGAKMAGDVDRPDGVLADLIYLVPEIAEGQVKLRVLVSEAKFVDSTSSVPAVAGKAERQLVSTLRKLARVFGSEPAIDRERWLSTIANILVDAGRRPAQGTYDPEAVAWYVRRGQFDVVLEGHCHIFVAPDGLVTEWSPIPEVDGVWKAIIGRAQTKALLQSICCPDFELDHSAVLGRLSDTALTPRSRTGNTSREPHVNTEGDPGEANGGRPEKKPPPAKSAYLWAHTLVANSLSKVHDPEDHREDEGDVGGPLGEVEQKVKNFLPRVGIRALLGGSVVTPNAFRVRIQGQIGVDAARVEKYRDQFKTIEGLELIRVEPEPGYLALSFRRPQRGLVAYLGCLRQREVTSLHGNTKIILGRREDTGALVYLDLGGEDPHALVGGMSNSGKSQLLRMMILDMALTNDPAHLQLILVDPKHVEFSRFRRLPHIYGRPVVVTKDKAIEVLHNLVTTMEERYNILAAWEVNNLQKYNQLPSTKPLPRIVVVFDEFADWMLDDEFKRTVNEGFQRLAGKARAAGIHLILSTQRPDNTVVSPILRANLGAKIALRVDKKANSEIILDEGGAQHLLGKGHGLARLGGEKFLFQAAFVHDDVVDLLVKGLEDAYGDRQGELGGHV